MAPAASRLIRHEGRPAVDWQIAALLTQDGMTNGAIYALLGAGASCSCSRSRASSGCRGRVRRVRRADAGRRCRPASGRDRSGCWPAWRPRRAGSRSSQRCVARDRAGLRRRLASVAGVPLAIAGLVVAPRRVKLPLPVQVAADARAPSRALGPLLYRIAYQPLAEALGAGAADRRRSRALRADRARPVCSSAPKARARRRSPTRACHVGALNVTCQSLWIFGDQPCC